MGSINKVILVGHVGKDPEVKYLDGGNCLAKFSLATSEHYNTKDGKRVEQTEWHNIIIWGKLAETVEKYVRKGSLLGLEGRIRTRSWEDNGAKKYMTEIICDSVQFLGKKMVDSNGAIAASEEPVVATNGEVPTDNLPF